MSAAVLPLVTLTVTWVAARRVIRWRRFDAVDLMMWFFAVLLIGRPALIVLGIDDPFPDELFSDGAAYDVAAAIWASQVWLLALTAGLLLAQAVVRRPPAEGRVLLSAAQTRRVLVAVTALALVTSMLLWARYGGATGLLVAYKIDKALAGQSYLRMPALVGAMLASAHLVNVVRRQRHRRSTVPGRRLLALLLPSALLLVNIGLSVSWGARDAAVLCPLAVLFGVATGEGAGRRRAVRAGGERRRSGRQESRPPLRWTRLAAGATGVLALAYVLRIFRDTAVTGATSSAVADASAVRSVSVATNQTMFDALVLAVRDWPARQAHHGFGELLSAIPVLGGGTELPLAVRFANVYYPMRRNGLPSTPVGEWHLSAGTMGIIVGGVLSGLLYAVVQRLLERRRADPLTTVLAVFFVGFVAPLGIWTVTAPRLAQLGLALAAVVVAGRLTPRGRVRATSSASSASRSPASRPRPGVAVHR